MLAKLTTDPSPYFDNGYIFEPKLDGIRCVAYIGPDGHRLINRSMIDVTDRFPEVRPSVFADSAVIDGELIIYNESHVPDFQLMQTRMNRIHSINELSEKHPAYFVGFDILECEGVYLGGSTLTARKVALGNTLSSTGRSFDIRYREDGRGLISQYEGLKFEGVMIKRAESPYSPGKRSPDWLKYKFVKYLDCFIIGVTAGYGKRDSTFGAVLLAEKLPNGELRYIGECGTGFDDVALDELTKKLVNRRIEIHSAIIGNYKAPWFWVQPMPVTVKFLERTSKGILRFPVFEGLT